MLREYINIILSFTSFGKLNIINCGKDQLEYIWKRENVIMLETNR